MFKYFQNTLNFKESVVESGLKNENKRYKKYYKEYYKNNKNKWELYNKRSSEKTETKEYQRRYREEHKKEIKQYNINYKETRNYKERERILIDPIYRLKKNLKVRIRVLFNKKGNVKSLRIEKIIGCNGKYFYNYLLKTYKDRYGHEWDGICKTNIDHIMPLYTAKTYDEVIKLFDYKNLQLLKAEDNRKKGMQLNWENV